MKKTLDIKKLILLNMPYILLGLFATNFGEAWRMAQGADASEKFLSLVAVLPGALQSFWPSLHPLDLLVGLCCGVGLRLAVYLKSKNAKKYRHGLEYGSARWGTREDIAPYVDPVFQNNVILTKTESLTMNSRPKDPKTARNKNVLVIGGSGSGKTRFWLKPNLMQMHSSFPVSQRIQFQLIVGCNLAQLRNIKYGQTRTAGNQNRLGCFARNKLSRTFYQKISNRIICCTLLVVYVIWLYN